MFDADVAIVGGGVIGSTAALALQDDGLRTTVFEPNEVGVGTAEGSAGYLHDGEIFPLAHAGMLVQLPHMLLDPLGPLVFRKRYLPHMLGWGMRFVGSMRQMTFDAATIALADLNRHSVEALVKVANAVGAGDLVVRGGGLKVCRDARTLEREASEITILKDKGIAAEPLDAAALHELEPNISDDLAGAIWFPNSAHCIDLTALGARIGVRVRERGAVVEARADRLSALAGGWLVHYGDGKTLTAKNVLVAAGHASGELLRRLRYRVPLAPGRGYHLMLRDPGIALRHPVIFHEPHFAATPMRAGLRLAGTVEFAAANAPPDMRRAERLYPTALPYLPGLRKTQATTWMGVRPMTPDSLPVIGRAARHSGLFYSFGHGHLGFTQSAVSARCVADLISGRTPPVDLRPFDLARFD
jgi:glycine/D-amino acid oxidase-like deaminating enzyme